MTGVINLYKPKGITSSDAVVKVKRLLHTRAVGHMGTLDPQGEGVLILGVGKATRLFDYYLSKDKVYEAEFTFGEETDTFDGEGEVLFSGGRMPTEAEIKAELSTFVGKQLQVPPLYSAKKVGGRKAYDIARSGGSIELKPCEIEIFAFELLEYSGNKIIVKVHCSSGTYIRSLCRDLAHKLGTYAIMTAIKRTRCGALKVDNSVRLEDLTPEKILSVGDALPEIEKLYLSDEVYKEISNGRKIKVEKDGRYLVFCKGEMFGIGVAEKGLLSIEIYMREE
ncbi:MAG: tRNA pseudouridine(55) synthase TruB [Clostridiales bacterium]|nr:tRNA pseudouridine(55) synthase TruB [Clostridiales bacterium]